MAKPLPPDVKANLLGQLTQAAKRRQPPVAPEHAPGVAAEALLLAARALRNATCNAKPAKAGPLLARMLRQLPLIATRLTLPNLEADCRALAEAYETGQARQADRTERRIMEQLKPLCH